MGVTISTHNGSAVRRDHNIRNAKIVQKEKHIDPTKPHEIWRDEKEREAYERIFGEAVKEYNAKQKREDRKIKNYRQKIVEDKKKHTVYELIIGIYGKDEKEYPLCSDEQGKEIMREFVENWKERNPSLELIGAYYHADEEGAPHVHIDYIPVGSGFKRGPKIQSGLNKALDELGFQTQSKKNTAQIQWERRENEYLERLCNERGLQVDHPREEGRKHLDTEIYKKQQELESLKGKVLTTKEVEGIKLKKTVFGSKEVIELPIQQALDIKATAKKITDLEKRENALKANEERAHQIILQAQERAQKILNDARKESIEAKLKEAEKDKRLQHLEKIVEHPLVKPIVTQIEKEQKQKHEIKRDRWD